MAERTVSVRLRAVTDQFERQMRRAADSTKAIERNAEGLSRAGQTMSRTLTPAVLGVAGAAATVGTEFESAMLGVEAVTGETGDALDGMSAKAQELGRTTQFSASEAAGALEFLGMAGFEADEAMTALPETLNLAAAGGLELERSADLASNVLQQFALDVEETGRVSDVLAQTARSSNTSVAQLGEAMQYAGPIANAAGLDIEETAAAMGAMGDAGIQASSAGTSLRGAMTRLLNASGPAADTLERLGIEAETVDGGLRPLPEIVDQLSDSGATAGDMMEIFGQRAGPAMAALVEQGGDSLRDLEGTIRDSGGAAEEMAETRMSGFRGALLELKSAAEGAGIALWESGIDDALEGVADGSRNALQWVAELPDPMLQTGAAIGGVAAASGPAMFALGKLGEMYRPMIDTVGALWDKKAGFGAYMRSGYPAAIAVAAAAVYELHRQFQAGRESGEAMADTIVESAANSREAVAGLDAELESIVDESVGMSAAGDNIAAALLGPIGMFGNLRDQIHDAGAALELWGRRQEESEATTADYAYTTGELTRGLVESSAAGEDAAGGIGMAGVAADEAGEAADDATLAFDDMREALEFLSGEARDVEEAQRAVLDAIDQVADAAEDSGGSLDINTEAGRQNREALQQAAEAAADHAAAVYEQTGDVDAAAAAAERHYESLLDEAEAAGISRGAAADYIEQLGLVPSEVQTAIELLDDEASAALDSIMQRFANIPRRIAVEIATYQTGPGTPEGRGGGAPVRGGPAFQHSGGPVEHTAGTRALGRSWGLAADEVPTVLQTGERVIPRFHNGALPSRASERVAMFDERMDSWTVDLFADATTSTDFDRAFARLEELEDIRSDAEQVVNLWDRLTDLQTQRDDEDDSERRADLTRQIADAEADIQRHYQDRRVAAVESAAERERELAANRQQYDLERMAAEQRVDWLRARRDEFDRFSDEWMQWERERAQAQDDLEQKADDHLADLTRMLDERDRVERSMADRRVRYEDEVAEARRRHAREVEREVESRAGQLRFDPLQGIDFEFGNRPSSIAENVMGQVEAVGESEDLLSRLMGRGLDEAVVEALGLDDPRHLYTLREFSRATDQEIEGLNRAILERNRTAGDRAERDAERAYTSLGSTLADMRADLDGQLADLHDGFREDMAEMEAELAEIGRDNGRSFSEAVADGLESGIPAIADAAKAARDAARRAGQVERGRAGSLGFINPDTGATYRVIPGSSQHERYADAGWERAHTGGLMLRDAPIIAQGGERIIDRQANRDLERMIGEVLSRSGGVPERVTIDVPGLGESFEGIVRRYDREVAAEMGAS